MVRPTTTQTSAMTSGRVPQIPSIQSTSSSMSQESEPGTIESDFAVPVGHIPRNLRAGSTFSDMTEKFWAITTLVGREPDEDRPGAFLYEVQWTPE